MVNFKAMRRAIAVAAKSSGLPFGAVIVRRATGEVVAEGVNHVIDSPTFHAEIDAINRCASNYPAIEWEELDIYATAEPCAMCQGAIEFAGIRTVYFGTPLSWLQAHGWYQIDIRAAEIARRSPKGGALVQGGVMEAECNALFEALRSERPPKRPAAPFES